MSKFERKCRRKSASLKGSILEKQSEALSKIIKFYGSLLKIKFEAKSSLEKQKV